MSSPSSMGRSMSPVAPATRSPAAAPRSPGVVAGARDGPDVVGVASDGLAAVDVALREAVPGLAVGEVLVAALAGDVAQEPAVAVLRGLGAVGHEVDRRADGGQRS